MHRTPAEAFRRFGSGVRPPWGRWSPIRSLHRPWAFADPQPRRRPGWPTHRPQPVEARHL